MENNFTIRLDKFLWCVRLFKTRKISSNFCSRKKVKINKMIVKPSKKIHPDDIIEINKKNVFYKYKVLQIINKRISPQLIKEYITDITPEYELDKIKIKNIYPVLHREKGLGRPTKKERRILKQYKIIK